PTSGVYVPNKIGYGGDYIHYNLSPLQFIAKEVHVFYDEYDVILAASKRNFLKDYKRLGQTGPKGGQYGKAFTIHPYTDYKNDMFLGPEISLKGIALKVIGKSQLKYNTRHQYFFSNKKVIAIINGLVT
ncbi:MAG: hypothetical protein MI892_29120, partial [Desulfobacterales bacterium]|nr:hypothetical protein [Desulfobacterales bacterium]